MHLFKLLVATLQERQYVLKSLNKISTGMKTILIADLLVKDRKAICNISLDSLRGRKAGEWIKSSF